MDFEQFNRAKLTELNRLAKDCFDRSQIETDSSEKRVSLLLESQFYMNEMDRQRGSSVALRDLLLELVVILLIGFEIILAVKQGRDEDRLMDKQNVILSSLQQSTSATTSTLGGLLTMTKTMNGSASATATTLLALKSTTEAMNKGVHDQLSLLYEPFVTLTFDMNAKKINVTNLGHTDILLTGAKYANEAETKLDPPQIISPTSGWFMSAASINDRLQKETPEGTAKVVPLVFYISNEHNIKYVVNTRLLATWENNKFVIYTQLDSVARAPH